MKKTIILVAALMVLLLAGGAKAETTKVSGVQAFKVTPHKVYLKWNKVEDAQKYVVRVVTQKNKKLKAKKKSKDNKAVIRGLKVNKKYRVKVKAKVNGKYRKNSKAKKFRTEKSALYLTGQDNETEVSWESSLEAEMGYKLVWSKNSKPTYPTRSGDKYVYYSDSDTTEGEIYAFDGSGAYYVRVCEYLGGECGKYSNQIKVELDDGDEEEQEEESEVESITLSAYDGNCTSSSLGIKCVADSTCYNVQWKVDGYSSNGFKLTWSKTSEPTYPTRSTDKYAYYSSSSQTKGKVTNFDGSGTYYVRVCEYLGGACGVYSNQIQIDL